MPNDQNFPAEHMSARDFYAALALHAMLTREQYQQDDAAKMAYTYADALLAAGRG